MNEHIGAGGAQEHPVATSQAVLHLRTYLGRGSFGYVYSAHLEKAKSATLPLTLNTGTTFAAKFLQPLQDSDEFFKQHEFLKNLVHETCTLPALSQKDLAKFHAPSFQSIWFRKKGVMNMIDSAIILCEKFTMDCGTWFSTQRQLTVFQQRQLVRALCRHLTLLHHSGIAHRDLKPGNMLVNLVTGHIVANDFGCSSLLEGRSKEDKLVSTVDIRAPEFLLDSVNDLVDVSHGTECDMWSLGIVMLCALKGISHEPLGPVQQIQTKPKLLRNFIRARVSGTFVDNDSNFGPDEGPAPKTFRERLARILFSSTSSQKFLTDVSNPQTFNSVVELCKNVNWMIDPADIEIEKDSKLSSDELFLLHKRIDAEQRCRIPSGVYDKTRCSICWRFGTLLCDECKTFTVCQTCFETLKESVPFCIRCTFDTQEEDLNKCLATRCALKDVM